MQKLDNATSEDHIGDRIALLAEDEPPATRPAHVVVFTGHRVDKPDRNPPRFPESCVAAAREAIRNRLAELKPTLGVAAAASGGDILFHEACADLGIPTEVLLVMPPQDFVNESVADNGQQWVEAFWTLIDRKKAEGRLRQLGDQDELPAWSQRKHQDDIWSRANLWILEYALSKTAARVTVMALWNGKEGDGPGGTKDLLTTARELGATPSVIDTNAICR